MVINSVAKFVSALVRFPHLPRLELRDCQTCELYAPYNQEDGSDVDVQAAGDQKTRCSQLVRV